MFNKHETCLKIPFTCYYDFEVSANEYMISISYAITIHVNNDYIKEELNENVNTYNHTTVKSIWMDSKELQILNLLDFFINLFNK